MCSATLSRSPVEVYPFRVTVFSLSAARRNVRMPSSSSVRMISPWPPMRGSVHRGPVAVKGAAQPNTPNSREASTVPPIRMAAPTLSIATRVSVSGAWPVSARMPSTTAPIPTSASQPLAA